MIVGVDFDTYKATMVGLPLQGWGRPVLEEVVFRKKAGDDEAYAALARVRSCLMATSLFVHGEVFFVERGWGASRKADYLMGAYFGAIYSALCSGISPTNVMNAQEWKKRISAAVGVKTKDGSPGRGDLTKPAAHLCVHEVAVDNGHDLSGWGPDALDAYAIATTGKWLNTAAASDMMGGVNDEYGASPESDAALRGVAGGVAVFDPEGGD